MQTKTTASSTKIAGISLPVLALIWVCFAWGSTWIGSKIGVRQVPALQLCAIRQIIGGIIWTGYFLLKKEPLPKKNQWGMILILALLNFFFSNALSTWGIEFISAGLGAILGAIFPLWIVIIYFFQGRKVAALAIFGMLLGFAGVCIIFYDHLKDFLIADFRLGIILSVLATITWAFGSVYTKKQMNNFNPYFGLGIQMLISGICLYVVATAVGKTIPLETISSTSWGALAFLIAIGSIATFAAYMYTLQHLSIELASVYAYVNPIVAVLLSSYIFNDAITPGIIGGGIVTLGGVYLVNYAMQKKG